MIEVFALICVAFAVIGFFIGLIGISQTVALRDHEWRAWLNGDRKGPAPDGKCDLGFYRHGKN